MGVSVYLVKAGTRDHIDGRESLCMGYGTWTLLGQVIYYNAGQWAPNELVTIPATHPLHTGVHALCTGTEGLDQWTTLECEAILAVIHKAFDRPPVVDELKQKHQEELETDLADTFPYHDPGSDDEEPPEPSILMIPPWFAWQHTRRGNWDYLAEELRTLLQEAITGKYDIRMG